MSVFDIRECESRDIEQVISLMRELQEVADSTHDFDRKDVEGIFDEIAVYPEIYANYVAVAGGRIVGFISVIFYKTLYHKGGTALINELVINRDYRGRGIGKALVDRTRDEALSRGMDELEVGTETDNLAARSFYKKCGFTEEYVLMGMEF